MIKNLYKIVIIFFCIIFFYCCDSFKRFGQEKYNCQENELSIYQINIIKTNSVKKAYLINNEGEFSIQIKSIENDETILSFRDFTISINKIKKLITVSNDKKIHFLNCQNETFNM